MKAMGKLGQGQRTRTKPADRLQPCQTAPTLGLTGEQLPIKQPYGHLNSPSQPLLLHGTSEQQPNILICAMGRDTLHWTRLLQAPSNLALDTSRDGAASLGSPPPSEERIKNISRCISKGNDSLSWTQPSFPALPQSSQTPAIQSEATTNELMPTICALQPACTPPAWSKKDCGAFFKCQNRRELAGGSCPCKPPDAIRAPDIICTDPTHLFGLKRLE